MEEKEEFKARRFTTKTLAGGQDSLNNGDRYQIRWATLVRGIRRRLLLLTMKKQHQRGGQMAQSTLGICPKNPAPAQTVGVDTFAPSASWT